MTIVDHILRVHVRLAVGGDVDRVRSGIDVCLPASSSLEEVLPEVLALIEAPQISLPWEARTAAGQPLSLHEPLSALGLTNGCIIVLGPRREIAPPVVKDAAEALVDHASAQPRRASTLAFSTLAGLAAVGVVVFSSAIVLPVAAKLVILGLACFALLTWPGTSVLVPAGALPVAVGAALAVGGTSLHLLPAPQAGLGVAAGAGTALFCAIAAGLFTRASSVATAGTAAYASVIGLSCAAAWTHLPKYGESPIAWVVGLASLSIVLGQAGMLFAPGIASSLSGLKAPRIPSAGSDLAESDRGLDDPDALAAKAVALHDGIHTGCAAAICCGLCGLAGHTGFAAQGLALATFLALAIHAHRQSSGVAVWSAWVPAALGVVVVAVTAGASPLGLLLAVPPALILATAPMWASRVGELEPTTISWFERIESVAVAGALPIALHLAGLFALIRGLG